MLNFLWPCTCLKADIKKEKEGYHPIWEANLQPLGPMFQHLFIYLFINILNVNIILAFISNLGPNDKPKKCSKLAPSLFGP
jgi:hypothetical protein